MVLSARANELVSQITGTTPKLGDIKKLGKQIKKDHDLALELWSTHNHYLRLLSTLILDKKHLTVTAIDELAADMLTHDETECNQLADWFLANQLMKDKKLIALTESWEANHSPVLRRWFWYYQARMRWTGKTPPPESSGKLLDSLETNMADAEPAVQWAMNFCAGQIGLFEPEFRARCISLGQRLGLYKDEPVTKNCTPSYLPEFIRIELAKRE